MKLKHCVYILQSQQDRNLYIGYTMDLKRRLTEHFHGRAKSTSHRVPFRLVFCEYFSVKSDATRRERYFKTSAGKRALKIMLRGGLIR